MLKQAKGNKIAHHSQSAWQCSPSFVTSWHFQYLALSGSTGGVPVQTGAGCKGSKLDGGVPAGGGRGGTVSCIAPKRTRRTWRSVEQNRFGPTACAFLGETCLWRGIHIAASATRRVYYRADTALLSSSALTGTHKPAMLVHLPARHHVVGWPAIVVDVSQSAMHAWPSSAQPESGQSCH